MSAGKYNITIDQGSTFGLTMTVKEDGSAKNLASPLQYTARAHLRSKAENTATPSSTFANGTIEFTCTGSTGVANLQSNGIINMSLTAAQTAAITAGSYVYDLEIVTGAVVTRIIQGRANVTREITR
jgi:hypothetical protein